MKRNVTVQQLHAFEPAFPQGFLPAIDQIWMTTYTIPILRGHYTSESVDRVFTWVFTWMAHRVFTSMPLDSKLLERGFRKSRWRSHDLESNLEWRFSTSTRLCCPAPAVHNHFPSSEPQGMAFWGNLACFRWPPVHGIWTPVWLLH